jgi:glycosyltransferase involved in cell wall biosynthesis
LRKELSILHVIRSPVGGLFRHVSDLAGAQREAGHDVGLICDAADCDALQEERIAILAQSLSLGVTRIPMGRSIGAGDVLSTIRVAHRIAQVRPDVVHTHGAKGGLFGRLGAALRKRSGGGTTAAFYAAHGGSLHYESGSLQGRVYFATERALERVTDGLIHVSDYEAETYRRKIGNPRCPAHVVRNGLRLEEFDPVVPAADPADFLFIGELRRLKGVDVFIEALAILEAEGLAPRAVVVGPRSQDERDDYAALAHARLGANSAVFHPPMPARAAFALARAVVMPSRAESMPYIVLEAAACGIPLIATDVGGIPEVFAGEAERLVRPGDAASLASAMRGALQAPERLAAEAVSRRERVKQNFSLAAAAAQIEGIYRSALEARYRPPRVGPVAEADLSR